MIFIIKQLAKFKEYKKAYSFYSRDIYSFDQLNKQLDIIKNS